MEILRVDIFRDGGTIKITIADDPKPGEYILPTPFLQEPRHLAYNRQDIGVGSSEEMGFLTKLHQWWETHATERIEAELDQFEKDPYRHSLSQPLYSYHYIRNVMAYLDRRQLLNPD